MRGGLTKLSVVYKCVICVSTIIVYELYIMSTLILSSVKQGVFTCLHDLTIGNY